MAFLCSVGCKTLTQFSVKLSNGMTSSNAVLTSVVSVVIKFSSLVNKWILKPSRSLLMPFSDQL